MSRRSLHMLVATLSSALMATAAQAQTHARAPGIEAYRTQPLAAVYAPLEANNAAELGNRTGSRDLIRARAALDRGDFNRAARLLQTRLYARDPDALYLSAVAQNGLGRHGRARSFFAEALVQAPDHVGARTGLALTDLRLGRRTDAVAGLSVLERRQAACAADCADAEALGRATQVIRHFLDQSPAR